MGKQKSIMEFNTILGLVAAFFTTASYVPQAIKTIRTRDTSNISKTMYIFLCVGVLLWFIHGIIDKSWPIIISNAISLVFSIIILIYKVLYK